MYSGSKTQFCSNRSCKKKTKWVKCPSCNGKGTTSWMQCRNKCDGGYKCENGVNDRFH